MRENTFQCVLPRSATLIVILVIVIPKAFSITKSTNALLVINNVMGLMALISRDSLYVFPGKVSEKPLQKIKTFWKRMLKEANLQSIRITNIHTHTSLPVSSGLLSIAGKLLGLLKSLNTMVCSLG